MKKLFVIGLSVSLAVGAAGCQSFNKADGNAAGGTEKVHKIGVAIYNADDDEVMMFRDYYQNYLEEAFPVEFIYSSDIHDYQDEIDFVDTAKEEGCEGIISFVTCDLSEIVKYCGDDMYYVMGSGTESEEEFNSVKNEENFLGIIGPSIENEAYAGETMIRALAGKTGDQKTYVLLSGGSAYGNFMHQERLTAMLRTLEKTWGFTFSSSPEELAQTKENTLAGTTETGGKVYICPGYLVREEFADNLDDAMKEAGEVDVVASVYYVSPFLETVAAKEKEQKKDVQVGTVDCFSEANERAFSKKDAFGNSQINFIGGKCAAMAAPAFAAMYNAVTGYEDVLRENGEAFWLNQDFWYAGTKKEYDSLSASADNIYKNVYGTKDIMTVLNEYTAGADFADFEAFTKKIAQ